MKAGDIIFVRGDSLLSKIIRFFDEGIFSHVAIAVSETEVIEANWNMKSNIVPFHYDNYEIVSLDLTNVQRSNVKKEASKLEGRWYDYIQIIGYMFNRRINNPRNLICSELVYLILSRIDFIDDKNIRECTPNELYRYLKGDI
jgi:hypothetical protein